jgi:hypothetical protein
MLNSLQRIVSWTLSFEATAFQRPDQHTGVPLRARRQRPCHRAAEKGDELAPFQLTQLDVLPLAGEYLTA